MSVDYPNHNFIKIGQKTEKSPRDLRRLEETCCYSNYSEKSSANVDGTLSYARNLTIRTKGIWTTLHPSQKKIHENSYDFDVQTDHLILTRRTDLIIINKKKENLQNCRLCCPRWPQNKTERMCKEGWVPSYTDLLFLGRGSYTPLLGIELVYYIMLFYNFFST